MIALPPGCTVNYEVTIAVHSLPDEFLTWWQEIGGQVGLSSWIDRRGKEHITPTVKYGNGRYSHKMAGADEYLIRFRGEDAGAALMFLMKWDNLVISHNMREVEQMKERHNAY